MITGALLGVLSCYFYTETLIHINKLSDEQKEREKVFQKWIFDSLYSINNKVLLPEEKEVISTENAIVISPEDDIMFQFKGSGFNG